MMSNYRIMLIKEYEKDRCIRKYKTDVPTAEEVNRILDAIEAKQIAIDIDMTKQIKGSNLFDLMFYMILHLSKEIQILKGSIR